VTSFNPQQSGPGDLNKAAQDGGSGAFGPGKVTITAGGTIRGHYLLADGIGRLHRRGRYRRVSSPGAESGVCSQLDQRVMVRLRA